jgi:hypothetical protein
VPEEVEIQIERMKFIHDKLILDVPDEDPTPFTGTEYADLNKPIGSVADEDDGAAAAEEENTKSSCCCMPKPVAGATRGPKMGKKGATMEDVKVEAYPEGEAAFVLNPMVK